MKIKILISATILILTLMILAADKPMKQVPFEVINKSGQEIHVSLFRYKDDYPSKYYYFTIEKGTRKRPQSGTWEVWKGDYNLIVFGENMSECLLPIDLDNKEAGIDITIKGRFRLVVPPCQEIFSNPGERSLLKYNWTRSFTKDPDTGQVVPYRNWFFVLGS